MQYKARPASHRMSLFGFGFPLPNDTAKLPAALVGQYISKRRDGPPVSFSVWLARPSRAREIASDPMRRE